VLSSLDGRRSETSNGGLVRRAHVNLGEPVFLRGHAALPDIISEATGRFLTLATQSPQWNSDIVRVAMKQILLAGLNGPPVEDCLSHAFRALDQICEGLGLKKAQQLTDALTSNLKVEVQTILKEANQRLRELSAEARTAKNENDGRVLERIAQQLTRATTSGTGFGKAVLDLLKRFDLPDGDVLAKHYQLHPRQDKKKWPELLSKYRGTVMHKGYFDFRTSDEQILGVHRVLLHLHDLVLRLIFKMLCYDGPYSPTVSRYAAAPTEIDWVRVDTPARKLGYEP